MESNLLKRLRVAADAVRSALRNTTAPRVGLILGSGWGELAREMSAPEVVHYQDIPGFPESTVAGHAGRLVFGRWGTRDVLVMQGRVHLYEGYTPEQVVFPVQVMLALGVRTLVVTNAAGAVNPDYTPGDLMLISDHINLTGTNALIGAHDPALGPRFPDMVNAYDPELRTLAQSSGVPLREGVYAGVLGPNFETPAEVRMLARLGADAVGMSTVHEVIAARHGGARVLGISCMSNKAAGLDEKPLLHADVRRVVDGARADITRLVTEVVERLET